MQSFEALYKAYYKDIYFFLNKLSHYDHHLAEELTQEAFYHAYLMLPKFKGACHIKTWIMQIAKNRYFMHLRKTKYAEATVKTLTETQWSSGMCLEDMVVEKVMMEKMCDVIFEMNSPMKEVVLNRIYTDQAYEVIANELGISVSSAKVLFHRGKKIIKKEMLEVK